MKRKLCAFAFTFLLFQSLGFFICAQTPIDTVKSKIDSLKTNLKVQNDSLNLKLQKIDSEKNVMSKQLDTLKRNDSLNHTDFGTSFSNALKLAKNYPKILYNKPFKNYWYISILAIIFLIFFLYKSFWYAKNSALLKDDSYASIDGALILKPYNERTYSYSRSQLFWWTIIIVSCYTIFYALYGVLLPLNPSVILLMGSGLAVFIFGKTIDSSQIKNNVLKTELPSRHQDIHAPFSFLHDILSDENGISIHRLQAVAFNVIYGIGFIGYFVMSINSDTPPYPLQEFEQWQLALLGISAAGYLGLKTNENGKETKEARENEALNKDNPPGGNPAETGGKDSIALNKDGKIKDDNLNTSENDEARKFTRDENNYQ